MYSNGFIPLITRPANSAATIRDIIFTNQFSLQLGESLLGILLTNTSDHYPVFYIAKSMANKKSICQFLKDHIVTKTKEHF